MCQSGHYTQLNSTQRVWATSPKTVIQVDFFIVWLLLSFNQWFRQLEESEETYQTPRLHITNDKMPECFEPMRPTDICYCTARKS